MPQNPNELSPLTLAFVGDGVYSLLVRERLAQTNRPAGELHRLSVKQVNARAQAGAAAFLEERLTEKEKSILKRGRNAHVGTVPKSVSVGEYHAATGLEALFGYLYLCGQAERMRELFRMICENAAY